MKAVLVRERKSSTIWYSKRQFAVHLIFYNLNAHLLGGVWPRIVHTGGKVAKAFSIHSHFIFFSSRHPSLSPASSLRYSDWPSSPSSRRNIYPVCIGGGGARRITIARWWMPVYIYMGNAFCLGEPPARPPRSRSRRSGPEDWEIVKGIPYGRRRAIFRFAEANQPSFVYTLPPARYLRHCAWEFRRRPKNSGCAKGTRNFLCIHGNSSNVIRFRLTICVHSISRFFIIISSF